MSTHSTLPLASADAAVVPGALSREQSNSHKEIASEIHEHSVPAFAAAALDRLHGSLYASFRYWQLSDTHQIKPHTWIAYRNGEIIGVLLFRVQCRSAVVLSEVIVLDQQQTDAFCCYVFRRFPQIRYITFNAVSVQSPPCSLPHQYFAFSENYVLTLPPTVDAYMAALGKSTRQSVRGYRNRLQRDFPDFSWTAVECDAMSTDQQRDLVLTLQRFKRESMAARGKSAAIDAAETSRFLAIGADCGLFGIGRIQGRVCAGSLSCRIGDTYVMLLSASDPALSAYRLGLLTCLWSVSDCISRNARECHLLWGRYQYKNQLLAVPNTLCRMIVYPSFSKKLMQPLIVLRMLGRSHYVRSMQWLREQLASKKHAGLRLLLHQLRLLKGMASRKP